VVVFELISRRKVSLFTLLTGVLSSLLCGASALIFDSPDAYSALFRMSLHTVAGNVRIYAETLTRFLGGGPASTILCGAVVILAVVQTVRQWRSKKYPPLVSIFVVLYLAVLLVYPPNEPRFLFPVFPILILLAAGAVQEWLHSTRVSKWTETRGVGIAVAVTVAAFAVLGLAVLRLNHEPIRQGFADPDFVQMTEFLRDQTQPSDRILFRKPRMLALLTRRHVLTYAPAPGLGDFVYDVRVNYIVVSASSQAGLEWDGEFLWPFIRAHKDALRLVYLNAGFRVYHVLIG
jgi:hypothetical protein